MPWCPNCKDEYREGITVCADCGAQLVDDLSLVKEEKIDEEEYIHVADIPSEIVELTEGMDFEAEKAAMAQKLMEQMGRRRQAQVASTVYVNNSEKAEENKSSAYVLLFIGIVGLVGIVLFVLNIIPNNIQGFSKYVISGVLGALFVLFTFMGFVSLRNFKIYKSRAYKENNLTEQIKKWCIDNLDVETIDSQFDYGDATDELKYFPRFSYLKGSIANQFMNLDDSYLERLTEEIYPEIFEKDGE